MENPKNSILAEIIKQKNNRTITLREVDAAIEGEKFVSIGYGRSVLIGTKKGQLKLYLQASNE